MATFDIKYPQNNEKSFFGADCGQDSKDIIVAEPDVFAWYLHNAWLKEPNYPGPLWIDHFSGMTHTFEEPSEFIIELAPRICSYYADRFMVDKLRKGHISKFREAAYEFVTRPEPAQMQACHTGIMTKLPDFYRYDVLMDEWEEIYNMDVNEQQDLWKEEVMDLTYVDTLKRYVSGSRQDEHWFANSDDCLVKIPVQDNNPLANVFERYLEEHNNTITIQAYFYQGKIKSRDNFKFIQASNWKLS